MTPFRIATIMRIVAEAQQRGWLSIEQSKEISRRMASAAPRASLEELLCPPLRIEQLSDLISTPPQNEPPPTLHSRFDAEETETPNPFRGESTLSMIVLAPPIRTAPIAQPTVHDTLDGYELRELLGRGGMGEVFEAYDPRSGRLVALKTLRVETARSPENQERFLREARISCQLEHPCVIPVYDLGSLPDGRPFYTMRIVRHRSLREVLPGAEAGWNIKRCCSALARVCRGLAYAHARGVLHRDLKPENILLGDYDEVYIADWGIAKVIGAEEPANELDGIHSDFTKQNSFQEMAMTIGSPGYMSPEQARGRPLDPRSDLFSVGVILYEILTDMRPFQGVTQLATLILTQDQEPTAPRDIFPDCPLVLEELCLLLLAKEPAGRPRSADAVANTLEAYLEGSLDQERRRAAATRLVEQARQSFQGYKHLSEVRRRYTEKAQRLLKELKPWDPLDQKFPGWELEDQAKHTATEQAKALAEAIELYSRALGHEPQNKAARRGLAELYWERAERALLERDEPARILAESMVQEYDDGHFRALLAAEASLSLRSTPSGAEVLAYPYYEKGRIELLGEKLSLGKTPLYEVKIPPGNYLLILRHPNTEDTRYPLTLSRGAKHQNQVKLLSEDQIGAGFVFIPKSSTKLGGTQTPNSLLAQEVLVDDCLLARFPVTFREYLFFLDNIPIQDAYHRLPRYTEEDQELPLVFRNEAGRFVPLYKNVVREAGRLFCWPTSVGELPVFGVSWFDAITYCRFRSALDGVTYQLPTEHQWEKAARGADHRYFPWGNFFDPSFCKMKSSRPGIAQPEPIGAFLVDESPYGVRDMAGGISEFVADIVGDVETVVAQGMQDAPDDPNASDSQRVARGGAWASGELGCYGAARQLVSARGRFSSIGFRLAKVL